MKKLKQPEAPKYWRLAEHFMTRIAEGKLKPGDQLPSFAQLRAEYGASRPTVERMLGILERKDLIDRQNGYGIFVAQPKAAVTSRGIIGLGGAGFGAAGQSNYWTQVLNGIVEELDTSRQQILLLSHDAQSGWEKSDGLLLYNLSRDEISELVLAKMPCVTILRAFEEISGVTADDYAGVYAALEHLLQLGHRKIAFLFSGGHVLPNRLAAYHDALGQAGIAPHPHWLRSWPVNFPVRFDQDFVRAGEACMRQWLDEDWHRLGCTALLAQNDEVAIGAIAALGQAGIDVPREVSVVGFDGVPGNHRTEALTTVEVPLKEISAAATQCLLRQIETQTLTTEHQVLPTRLRIAQTTAPPI